MEAKGKAAARTNVLPGEEGKGWGDVGQCPAGSPQGGFPEVGLVLQRHGEGTLRFPLSLTPLPPMLMSFTLIFLAGHADSQLFNGVVHLHAQAFVEHLFYTAYLTGTVPHTESTCNP